MDEQATAMVMEATFETEKPCGIEEALEKAERNWFFLRWSLKFDPVVYALYSKYFFVADAPSKKKSEISVILPLRDFWNIYLKIAHRLEG